MISFRFHVVSITAVFLAIAIGVIVGTTYVDRAVVENLENRIDTVSENLDERRAQIDALETQLDDLESYAEASSDFAVTDRLPDVPVLLLATRGIDEGVAEQLATLLRRAGARTPGVVWMEPAWALEDDEARRRLAELVGAEANRSDAALRDLALDALTGSLTAPEGPEVPAPDGLLFQALVDAGFLSVDDVGDASVPITELAGASSRVVVLTGTEADREVAELVPEVLVRAVDRELASVVADVFVDREDGPERGERLRSLLPEDLRERLVVVDAADQPAGRVAAVVGLGEAAAGRAGHYGYGPEADGVLPVWSAP